MQGITRRTGRTRTTTALAVAAIGALALAACAGHGSVPAEPSPAADDDVEMVAATTVLATEDGEPQLCLGGVMESYPPQCGGPVVHGLDWDELEGVESASGTTWWSGYVVGTWDGEALTLTRTPSADAPDGMPADQEQDPELAALCEDPYRGGDEDFGASSDGYGEATEELQQAAAELPGYVSLYVSDGSAEFNVVVTSDADGAHDSLREVWPGWLCVAERDVADAADVQAAADAVGDIADDAGVLAWGGSGAGGVLEVQVVVDDDATRTAVLDAVEPWLTEDQVSVVAALRPLTA